MSAPLSPEERAEAVRFGIHDDEVLAALELDDDEGVVSDVSPAPFPPVPARGAVRLVEGLTDPEPMWDEVIGQHRFFSHVCPKSAGCVFAPRARFSQARADYPQVS